MTAESIAGLLEPYASGVANAPLGMDWPRIYGQLAIYLELLLKWNARMNLTAIRDPKEIVRRHFGDSLFVGVHLGECSTLLDFGSGAGFPGIPIQLMRPNLRVTLAESQNKKAAFLHEVVRSLGLQTEVWPRRVEVMASERRFDAVTLRAVDKMDDAIQEAAVRAVNQVLILGTSSTSRPALDLPEIRFAKPIPFPGSIDRLLLVGMVSSTWNNR